MIRVVHPNPDPDILPIPDPRLKKALDPGSGSATLASNLKYIYGKSRGLFYLQSSDCV
jgi:hypothetical protein